MHHDRKHDGKADHQRVGLIESRASFACEAIALSSLLLNRYPGVVDPQFDTLRFGLLSKDVDAKDNDEDHEHADYEIEFVLVH